MALLRMRPHFEKCRFIRGVLPIKSIEYHTTEDICNDAIDLVNAKQLVETGDIVVLTAGIFFSGNEANEIRSNMMKIAVIE